jgi:hypothetical protein
LREPHNALRDGKDALRQQPVDFLNAPAASQGCDAKMTTQVVILRAVRSFAPNLARLTGTTTAFFNRLLG